MLSSRKDFAHAILGLDAIIHFMRIEQGERATPFERNASRLDYLNARDVIPLGVGIQIGQNKVSFGLTHDPDEIVPRHPLLSLVVAEQV